MIDNNNDLEKKNFFNRMKTSEHKGFEISMFAISVALALAVLITAVWIGVYIHNANSSKITDAEADEGSVTGSAVVADEDDDPQETPIPDQDAIVSDNEDYDDEVDPDLKDAEYGFTTAVVNLRSEASLTASVIVKVPMGARVKLISMTKDNWMEVNYKGTTGFIHARYLSAKKLEPIATIAPTAAPTAAPTNAPTPKPTRKPRKPRKTKKPATEEPDITDEPEDTPEPTEAPTEKPTEAPTERPTKAPTEKPSETKAPENPEKLE